MKTQAPQPAKTSKIPSISKSICNGDLYCSKAHPMQSIKTNKTLTIIIIIGMILGKSGEQYNASADGPDGNHPAVVVRHATDARDASHSFNAPD